jgi:nucleoside-diphosphate-sugar epimerase
MSIFPNKTAETKEDFIIRPDEWVLVTGATGFIGANVVESLVERGFRKVRCFTRVSSNLSGINALVNRYAGKAQIEVVSGNLLSRQDCLAAVQNVAVVYHLAMGTGQKSIPHSFLNTVVVTRNLLDAILESGSLKRFVNMSSFVVYTNREKPQGRLLDESCPMEDNPARRGEAYTYAKVRQDEIVMQYGREHKLPYVLLRPGVVYGPGKNALTGRVGIDTFGLFLHLGGSNTIPLTYVKNCADAIVLAGIRPGIDGETFNIVDDDLPSSKELLRLYKENVRSFNSVYLPKSVSYFLCLFWEKYSQWSDGQLPPQFSRWGWHVYWKKSRYSNEKLKKQVGWKQLVPTSQGLTNYFAACKGGNNA